MRNYGINYDTGLTADGDCTRTSFDDAVVRRDLQIIATDLRDADNAAGYRDALRAYRRFGKPMAVTEFGCRTYRGAAGRGGMGWMIVDEKSDPPVIPGIYERDEEELVRRLHDMLAVYEAEDIDSAFWFTFAGFEQPRHHTDPHRDLDLASYGVVAVLEHERGTTYPDMAWEPKQVFGALAAAYARARP